MIGLSNAWASAPGYEQLAQVLRAAYDQAAAGKGAERHARGNAFHEQHMQTISDLLSSDRGMAFQAIKKLTEGLDFAEDDRFERELLGAINYIAGAIIWRRRQAAKRGGQALVKLSQVTQAEPQKIVDAARCLVCDERHGSGMPCPRMRATS